MQTITLNQEAPMKSLLFIFSVFTPYASIAKTLMIPGTFPTGKNLYVFQLGIQDCHEARCPIVLQLLKSKKVINSKTLEWDATAPRIINQNQKSQESASGNDANISNNVIVTETSINIAPASPTLSVQAVILTKIQPALLIDQTIGFDHVSRLIEIYTRTKEDKIKRVWRLKSGPGPRWISISMTHQNHQLVLTSTVTSSYTALELWQQNSYAWSTQSNKMEKTKSSPTYFAIIGSYTRLTKAIAIKRELDLNKRCVSNFLVLKTDSYNKLKKGLFVIAYPSYDKNTVTSKLANAKKCNPKIDGYIKRAQ